MMTPDAPGLIRFMLKLAARTSAQPKPGTALDFFASSTP
jgi:hypothetical protein